MVEAAIRGGAVYSPSFFGLLAIAGLIGAVGILTNSQILIVGAMVVGPNTAPSSPRRWGSARASGTPSVTACSPWPPASPPRSC
jgi:hypothetical protein